MFKRSPDVSAPVTGVYLLKYKNQLKKATFLQKNLYFVSRTHKSGAGGFKAFVGRAPVKVAFWPRR